MEISGRVRYLRYLVQDLVCLLLFLLLCTLSILRLVVSFVLLFRHTAQRKRRPAPYRTCCLGYRSFRLELRRAYHTEEYGQLLQRLHHSGLLRNRMEETEPDEPPSRPPSHYPYSNVDLTSASPAAAAQDLNRRPTSQGTETSNQARDLPLPLSKWTRTLKTLALWLHDVKGLVCCSRINVLLIFVPLGVLLGTLTSIAPVWIFASNALAIVPLAIIISASTETLAARLGDTLGALLNVTVGNTAELSKFLR